MTKFYLHLVRRALASRLQKVPVSVIMLLTASGIKKMLLSTHQNELKDLNIFWRLRVLHFTREESVFSQWRVSRRLNSLIRV